VLVLNTISISQPTAARTARWTLGDRSVLHSRHECDFFPTQAGDYFRDFAVTGYCYALFLNRKNQIYQFVRFDSELLLNL